jgi:eukaryotic-like serine/threonine-protein kinase
MRARRRRRRRGGRRLSVQTFAAGRYRVEGELGHGGMASVYLAHDEELDRPVAVKLLAAHLAGEEGLRERFVREARMAARLSHPNIVQVFDAGEEDGRPFIVMECVRGETVADELRRHGKLSPARVVDLGLQVCGGLEHAHVSGLVHRDVKPQNILLREDGAVKIADFGIARAAEATKLTQIGSVLGTAAYLAPEQAAGEPVTAAADIYSLGVVLYQLLTGRPPYEFGSLAEIVVKQREEAITPIRDLEPSVPERLEAVVMRCLARNPAYRPASAAELAHELAAASPEPPTVPLPPETGVRATDVATVPLAAETRARPAARPPRRDFALPGRAVWAIVAALAVLAAVVIGFAVAGLDGGAEPAPQERAPQIEPIPPADDAAQQARNLAEWLRQNSG